MSRYAIEWWKNHKFECINVSVTFKSVDDAYGWNSKILKLKPLKLKSDLLL